MNRHLTEFTGTFWLYIVGPCIGSAIAAAIFKVQHLAAPKAA